MPHCTHTEYDFYTKANRETVEILTGTAFSGDAVTTGQTAQTVCFACSLSTAHGVMATDTIQISVFMNS